MKNLEEKLGITLINRTHTGITLTNAGKCLVKTSQRFLLDVDNIIKDASPEAFSTVTGDVRFYASYGVLNAILPRIICLFYQSYPQITITASQSGVREMFDSLNAQQREQEFALLYLIAGQDTHGLKFQPLFRTQLLLNCSPDNPLARYKSLSFKTALSKRCLSTRLMK